MAGLRDILAEHGFESNDDYDFQVRCLLEGPTDGIRTLSIEGDGERRKTAFATALGHALFYDHVLYHDFSDDEPPPEVILPPGADEHGRREPPIDPLDDIVSKACALSEGERTVLILDQLQSADFRDHIRIHRLIRDRRWLVRDAPYHANRRNLLLFLISETPLYHALQRESFRIWIGRVSERRLRLHASDFGFGSDAAPLFGALSDLLAALDATPTRRELERLLNDITRQVQTEDHLRHALFGRVEGIDRERLCDETLSEPLRLVVERLRAFVGTDEIQLGGD